MRAKMQADATLPRHSYALGRMLFSDDVQQRLLLLLFQTPILSGRREVNLLLQLRRRSRVRYRLCTAR